MLTCTWICKFRHRTQRVRTLTPLRTLPFWWAVDAMYIGPDSWRVLVSVGVQLAKDKRSPNKKKPKKTAAALRAGRAPDDENRAPPPHSRDIEDFVTHFGNIFGRSDRKTSSGWDSDGSAELDNCTFRGVGKSSHQVHQSVSTGPLQARVHHPPATASHPGAPHGQPDPPVRVPSQVCILREPAMRPSHATCFLWERAMVISSVHRSPCTNYPCQPRAHLPTGATGASIPLTCECTFCAPSSNITSPARARSRSQST